MLPHNRLSAFLTVLALLAAFACSCAVDGGLYDDVPPPPPASGGMPAARMGLPPVLRPFHDELTPYGDWVLVEPRGWVFRPRVNTVAWRPYQDGYWTPSYTFGWVWESNDAFGWITDHYGFWFHDPFQGWVWQPHGAWAPAWVAWVQVGDFVGWAPLGPDDASDYDRVPGGVFTFVRASALGQAASSVRAGFASTVPAGAGDMKPLDAVASYRGVSWNAGPDLNAVLGTAAADRLRANERDGQGLSRAPSRSPIEDTRPFDRARLDRLTRNLVRVGARELSSRGGVRPGGVTPPPPAPRPEARPTPARGPVRDTTLAPGDSLRRMRRGAAAPGRPGMP